jgi:hypothetical protein
VNTNPIHVTRQQVARGYRWLVTYTGVYGDVGPLAVDGDMLTGDDARITTSEVVKGSKDIFPGDFTYEVQTITTSALSTIHGTFELTFEGKTTDSIDCQESELGFMEKLEKITTIHTANVNREIVDPEIGAYAWKVTFTHSTHEMVQGAGNLGLFTVPSSGLNLNPSTTAEVNVTSDIAGTDPFVYKIPNLRPGVQYFARVTAYNSLGYSEASRVAMATPMGAPGAPTDIAVGVASGTSLSVHWAKPEDGGEDIDGYDVEWFEAESDKEVQIITTSSTDGITEI